MSTKTTFKRIALVAVAALGFGLLSVAPSNAGIGSLWTIEVASSNSTSTIGGTATATFKSSFVAAAGADLTTIGCQMWSIPGTSSNSDASLTLATGVTTALPLVNGAWQGPYAADSWNAQLKSAQINATAAGRSTGYTKLTFSPDKAGTYVVRCFQQAADVARSIYTDWTLTVAAPTTSLTTAFISTTVGSEATADTAAASRTAAAAASDTEVARFTVKQYSTTDTTTAITSGYASAVTATVAGAGILGLSDTGSNRSSLGVSVSALGTGVTDFYLFPDGRTGVSTVTITVGTTVITKTFTFYGTLSTYARAAADEPKTHIGIGETDVMNIVGKDSTGNLTATAGTIYAKSSDATVASVSVSSQAVTVTGVKSGTATITVCDTADCVSATKSITIPVAVAKISAASFTLAFDKAEYTQGEKMTITVKAVDSNGAGVADGSRNLFSSTGITSNASLTGASWSATAAVALVAGVKTYTVYAPLVPGTVSIMATQGTAVDAVAAGGTAAVISASAVVVSDGVAQAAADAAAEATDAANAATDAANAAAEAADAATAAAQDAADAVAALATQVTEMVNALKKQITALTNLVIKIQKKVKA
jgi:hypothetical protein